jgi:hypothetical protein
MSITAIARQAQGIRAGEVIAKLAEEAYFMRVDNRVNQPPPARPRDNEATSRSAKNGPNRTRAELPAEPNRRRSNEGEPSLRVHSNREVAQRLSYGSSQSFSVEYPFDMCCLLQDVAERSRQKSEMLQGYGDAVLRAEALEEQLVKSRKHATVMQSKLDSAFAQYHNDIQDM